ncbi:hypothetical protein BJX61DRAFT_545590 [Aspergillus egyptiacus]|nr:hypothetical protein BJX61DRAFT_545590 [Aspergillus egyptiacus]
MYNNTRHNKSCQRKTREDDTLSLDDPKGLKVMAKVNDIKNLMDAFKSCIPSHQREWVDDALDDYMDTILKRNGAVLEYNTSVQLLMDARRDEKNAQEQAAKLGEKKLALDPAIPAIALWLRGTKDKFALQLMQRLYYASRAVAYWGLETSFKFEKPGPLRSSVELQNYRIQLDGHFESILSRFAGNVRSIWPRTESDQGLIYDLTSEQLKSLKTGSSEKGRKGKLYKVTVSLQPKDKPFGGGRADVRLNEVRLWLIGAKVKHDGQGRHRLMAHVRHMGDDVFEDESNNRLVFSHDSMTIPFEFDAVKVHSKADLTTAAILNRADALQDQWTGGRPRKDIGITSVAAVGPFASWSLEVREAENEGLDMQGVTSAHLEFCGANRSFTYSLGHSGGSA